MPIPFEEQPRRYDINDKGILIPRAPKIVAKPYSWRNPSEIPPREWLYGKHAVRKFISSTTAPGGVGKSSLAKVELLAVVTGKNLLNDPILKPCAGWYLGLEDPLDEGERRLAGAIKHYGLDQSQLQGGLFLNSGRDGNFVLVWTEAGKQLVAIPEVEAIKNQIMKHYIGLVIVDPFVASHGVNENDNGAIEAVMRMWAQIADETGAAIELIHHVRKQGTNQELTADDVRGARSFVDKTRSTRVLNVMTESEAEKTGVKERRSYFRVTLGKVNMVPPAETAVWRKLEGVDLENGRGGPSDFVGVATSWTWPDPFADICNADLDRVQRRLADGTGRAHASSPFWAGYLVAEVLGLNAGDAVCLAKIKSLLNAWIQNRALKIVEKPDKDRKDRKFIVPNYS